MSVSCTPTIIPEIILDKESYSPSDKMLVTIISPDSNEDPNRQDSIKATVSSSQRRLIVDVLETESNSGIFEAEIYLTTDGEISPNTLLVNSSDSIDVRVVVGSLTASKTAEVR